MGRDPPLVEAEGTVFPRKRGRPVAVHGRSDVVREERAEVGPLRGQLLHENVEGQRRLVGPPPSLLPLGQPLRDELAADVESRREPEAETRRRGEERQRGCPWHFLRHVAGRVAGHPKIEFLVDAQPLRETLRPRGERVRQIKGVALVVGRRRIRVEAAAHPGADPVPDEQLPNRGKLPIDVLQILPEVVDQVTGVVNATMHGGPCLPWGEGTDVLRMRLVLAAVRQEPREAGCRPPLAEGVDDLEGNLVELEKDDFLLHGMLRPVKFYHRIRHGRPLTGTPRTAPRASPFTVPDSAASARCGSESPPTATARARACRPAGR